MSAKEATLDKGTQRPIVTRHDVLYNAPIPIMVVEDNDDHLKSIELYFKENALGEFELTPFNYNNESDIYKYKADHPSNQIVILDIDLEALNIPMKEGIKLAKDWLWPLDRSTFFIVFSKYPAARYVSTLFCKAGPHWIYLEKKESILGGCALSAECLEALLITTRSCAEYSTPVFAPVAHSEEISRLSTEMVAGWNNLFNTAEYKPITESFARSANVLDVLSSEAVSFARAGWVTHEIGIGVYGSGGRLEMRTSSDVEFSIYFDGEATDEKLRLSVSLWNRLAIALRDKGIEHEWYNKIITRALPILTLDDVQNQKLEVDGYLPVISLESLRTSDWGAVLKNRYFQFLTELRPIFNRELIEHVRQELLYRETDHLKSKGKYVSRIESVTKVQHLPTAMSQSVLGDISNSFLLTLKPSQIQSADDLKRLTFRVVNVLCLRLTILQLCMDSLEKRDNTSWSDVLEGFPRQLVQPGIHKVVRFASWYSDRIRKNDDVLEILKCIISTQAQMYVFMEVIGDDENSDELVEHFNHQVRPIISNYMKLIEKLKSEFKAVNNAIPWVFSTDLLKEID